MNEEEIEEYFNDESVNFKVEIDKDGEFKNNKKGD